MANFAQSLKHEIARLARREIRAATVALRKATQGHRHDIAALKRQIIELERKAARLGKSVPNPIAAHTSEPPLRFVAKGFRTHRAKLGLSAPSVAKLLQASEQSFRIPANRRSIAGGSA